MHHLPPYFNHFQESYQQLGWKIHIFSPILIFEVSTVFNYIVLPLLETLIFGHDIYL